MCVCRRRTCTPPPCGGRFPDSLCSRFENDTLKNGMMAVANLLRIVAPLYLMCAPQDVAVVYQVKCPFTDRPTHDSL